LLELGNIVPTQHRSTVVEKPPLTKPVTGFDKGAPRLYAAHAVDTQTPAVLEGFDGCPGPRYKLCRWVGSCCEPGSHQSPLEILDGSARRPRL
jgi:hypothetical protein